AYNNKNNKYLTINNHNIKQILEPYTTLTIKRVRKSNTNVLRTKNFWVFAFFNTLILKYRLINSIKINPTIAKIYCLFIKKLASIGAPPVKDPFEAETILAL